MSTDRTGAKPVVPPLLEKIIDDAAVFPPGGTPLGEAFAAHRAHRAAWYSGLVGPLLLPASEALAGRVAPHAVAGEALEIGLVADTGVEALPAAAAALPRDVFPLRQIEVQVAKRGQDQVPGLRRLLALAGDLPSVDVYAEIPLTWGLLDSLDTVAGARAAGVRVAPKFRTGGLAAELFPTPVELAAVICACRERDLPFKLTAGLHHAVRHNDPETGLTHHGFLNVLAATLAAVAGAEVVDVAERLAATDPLPLIEAVRRGRGERRPLWISFGSCGITEPLGDLRRLRVLTPPR